ncbi:hypothetical protein [Pseudomonas spirodelae]|uniref:Secreted protein n=1 Tax=Pseudomonas spirodelae TaxID=3101751 RepID=A0ABU5PCF6_9PSED|nr:hypothetical protein [Pseudomonas sp. T5W1]MEA1607208.1 hypothetical protein [Pseudomonas sp. T5W1]
MNAKISILFAVAFLATTPNLSEAVCRKAQVCDNHGMNCQVQDICDNSFDLPSVEIAPLTPLPSTELKPLPSVDLPPLGTTKCQYMQVNGQWQNICN